MTYVILKVKMEVKVTMKRIINQMELEKYINKYTMNDLFSRDMKSFMELLFYKKNEYIAKDSENMKYLLFLVKGKAKVFMTLSNGKSLLLCFYQEFKVLGDLEIMESQKAVTNVQVIEDSYCIGIPIAAVKEYLLEDAKFLRFICSSLGNKLTRCSKNSSINLLYSLENRLASYIYTTGNRIPTQEGSKIVFEENLTHIAELLGTSYRHLLRTLTTLCKKNIIKKTGSFYEVTDEKVLYDLSSDLYR
jgi:CRP/FNR family transcriptional regulator, putaive post-exponential-phase nitrogen-starvation regulator